MMQQWLRRHQLGNIGLVRLMLKLGAVIYNLTLSKAIPGNHLNIIRLMINLGAGVSGWPITVAKAYHHQDLVNFFYSIRYS